MSVMVATANTAPSPPTLLPQRHLPPTRLAPSLKYSTKRSQCKLFPHRSRGFQCPATPCYPPSSLLFSISKTCCSRRCSRLLKCYPLFNLFSPATFVYASRPVFFSYNPYSTRSSFFYQPWAICDPAASPAADDAASSQSPALVLVTPSLACRAQLLPLISRKIGTLFQFAFHDIGQLLCSFYSGCVPVEIMTETRALLYGQKVCSTASL